jgi:hypothetical protein
MTKGRMAVAIAAAFVVSQILAVAVHGFLLNADYEPFRGTLLRADASWQMLTLPVAHLLFISALVWVFAHADFRGSMLAQGAKLGVLGWMAGQAPLWLLWYGEQPWPGQLVVKQLVLELVSSVVLGLTIAAVARRRHPARNMVSAV